MKKHIKKIISSVIFSLMVIAGVAFSEYFPDVIVTSPNGIWTDTRAYSSINSAMTAVGALNRDIYIIRQEATSTLTIPSNVRLHFFASGSIANTGQLTINTKDINAGNYRIFTGVGNIDFAPGSMVKSKWFNNFETALALTVNDTVTLKVTDSATLTSSFALGDNVSLNWDSPGNVLTANAGVTISNIRDIDAGEYLILTGAGNFRFRDGAKLKLSWFSHFRSAITHISTTKVSLTASIPSTVDFSDVSPANISIYVNNGGLITISTGITLTINGTLNAEDYQIFDCVGTGAIAGLRKINPTWIGLSTAATGTNNQIYLTKAIAGLVSGGIMQFAPGLSYPTVDLWTIDKAVTIEGNGSTLTWPSDTAADRGLRLTASNITIKSLNLTGPQYATYRGTQEAIRSTGTYNHPLAPTYLTGINIKDCVITNWGGAGITLQHAEHFNIEHNHVENIHYAGIRVLSSRYGHIHRNYVGNVPGSTGAGGTSGNAYGIATSFVSEAGSTKVSAPPCEKIEIDNNMVYYVPLWEAYDTHGGIDHNFHDNIAWQTRRGIMIGSASGDSEEYPALRNKAVNNTLITTIAGAGYGITDAGNASVDAETYGTQIIGNYISGYGTGNGAIYALRSNQAKYIGNTLVNVGTYGFELRGYMKDYIIAENTIIGKTVNAGSLILLDPTVADNHRGKIINNILDGTNSDGATDYGINHNGFTYRNVSLRGNKISNVTTTIKNPNHLNFERYTSLAVVPTVGAGTTTLGTRLLYEGQMPANTGIRIVAAGDKTNTNGNKTGIYHFGATTITFDSGSTADSDWRFEATVWFITAASQVITWKAWNGDVVTQGVETAAEDNSSGNTPNYVTYVCANKLDVVTGRLFTVERIYSE